MKQKRANFCLLAIILMTVGSMCMINFENLISDNQISSTSDLGIVENSKKYNEVAKSSQTEYFREGYALLAGVSDYPGTESDLSYCVSDSNDFKGILSWSGVPDKNIVQLSNGQATESRILSEISSIASKMDSNDYFIFQYSGHGTFTEQINSKYYSINSPHPYSNFYDHYWYINEPGAIAMRVHFSQIDTEAGIDLVWVGDGYETSSASDLFTGQYYDVWSNWVLSDKLYVELDTDYSITDWGFRVDKYEYMVATAPYGLYPYSSDIAAMLSGDELKTALDSIPGQVISFIDSCHSGGVGASLTDSNMLTLCACRSNEFSIETSELQNGLFTNKFVSRWNYLKQDYATNPFSFEDCYSACTFSVTNYYDRQHPVIYDNDYSKEMYLAPFLIVDNLTINNKSEIEFDGKYGGLGGLNIKAMIFNTQQQTMVEVDLLNNALGSGENTSHVFPLADHEEISEIAALKITLDASYYDHEIIQKYDFVINEEVINAELDTDQDFIDDLTEFSMELNPYESDMDGDGILDGIEIMLGSSPVKLDSDQDGMPDFYEYENNLILCDDDSEEDIDLDGVTNIDEFTEGTNPNLADTDGDGFSDGEEIDAGTDPLISLNNPKIRSIRNWAIGIGIGGLLIFLIGVSAAKQAKQKKLNYRERSIPRTQTYSSYQSTPRRNYSHTPTPSNSQAAAIQVLEFIRRQIQIKSGGRYISDAELQQRIIYSMRTKTCPICRLPLKNGLCMNCGLNFGF